MGLRVWCLKQSLPVDSKNPGPPRACGATVKVWYSSGFVSLCRPSTSGPGWLGPGLPPAHPGALFSHSILPNLVSRGHGGFLN